MEVSNSGSSNQASSVGVEALKKSIDIQEQQVLKVLESSADQAQKVAAQKTGLGNNLNISS